MFRAKVVDIFAFTSCNKFNKIRIFDKLIIWTPNGMKNKRSNPKWMKINSSFCLNIQMTLFNYVKARKTATFPLNKHRKKAKRRRIVHFSEIRLKMVRYFWLHIFFGSFLLVDRINSKSMKSICWKFPWNSPFESTSKQQLTIIVCDPKTFEVSVVCRLPPIFFLAHKNECFVSCISNEN